MSENNADGGNDNNEEVWDEVKEKEEEEDDDEERGEDVLEVAGEGDDDEDEGSDECNGENENENDFNMWNFKAVLQSSSLHGTELHTHLNIKKVSLDVMKFAWVFVVEKFLEDDNLVIIETWNSLSNKSLLLHDTGEGMKIEQFQRSNRFKVEGSRNSNPTRALTTTAWCLRLISTTCQLKEY